MHDISGRIYSALRAFSDDYLGDMLDGRHLLTAYAEDLAGYVWTRGHSHPHSYAYDNVRYKRKEDDARMMTFNIQRVRPQYDRSIWDRMPWFIEHRLWRIFDIIQQFQPDVICFQEIEPGMAFALQQELSSSYMYAYSYDLPIHSTLPNPILYDSSRYDLIDMERHIIDQEHHRLFVSVTLYDRAMGVTYDVHNVHQDDIWHEYSFDLQDAGFQRLYDMTRHTSRPYIVCGDFNTPYQTISSRLCHVQHAYTGRRYSWINWESDDYRLIDTICLDRGFSGSVIQSEIVVFADEVDEDNYVIPTRRASDHRPLYADIRFSSGSSGY